MRKAAADRLTRGYAALGSMESQCARLQFQEPRTKLWLFDTLVTPALLYGVPIWGSSLYHTRRATQDQPLSEGEERYEGWEQMERPLVMMISRLIRSKPSVPHEIVRAELGAPPIVAEALAQTVTFLHRLWSLPRHRYSRLALESSKQLASQGDTECWYARTQAWLQLHGLHMDHLPPLQYSLDSPHLRISREELNRVIRADIIQLHTARTWVSPAKDLGKKMAFYREHLLRLTPDGFIIRPRYMDVHLSHGVRSAIRQLRTSSHQLRIETGRYGTDPLPREDRICQLCQLEPETEEHYICRCPVYYEIRGRFHCLFKEGFGPLSQILDFPDQKCLGLFLLELHRHRDHLLRVRDQTAGNTQQRTLQEFYRPSATPSTTRTAANRPVVPPRGVTLERATERGRARRPHPAGPPPRRRYHIQIQRILQRHRGTRPRRFSLSMLDRPMRDILG